MNYNGKSSVKGMELVSFVDDDFIAQFMKKKGIFMEYLLEYEGKCHTGNAYDKRAKDYNLNEWNGYDVRNFRGHKYYLRRVCIKNGLHETYRYYVFRELDPFYDYEDEKGNSIIWKTNGRHRTKETTYISGNYEFNIVARKDGTASIGVKYTKSSNMYRTRVTLDRIEVTNGTTMQLIDAINAWKKGMINELSAVA